MNGLSNDQQVVAYSGNKADEQMLNAYLEHGTRKYLLDILSAAFDWYDLNSKWGIHEASYKNAGSKTEKGKNKSWVTHQTQAIQSCMDPAKNLEINWRIYSEMSAWIWILYLNVFRRLTRISLKFWMAF